MAITLLGNWVSGKAFDLHTVASTHLGADQFGHERFENTRSEMGELVYQLKYKQNSGVLPRILELLDGIGGIEGFDYLVPVPPTKKNRSLQPVDAIVAGLGARRGVAVLRELLCNSGDEELKGVSDPVERNERLEKSIFLTGADVVAGKKVLLVDDLFRSGATLALATKLIYTEGHAASVSVLTMTKTRSNR